ncbi:hypothetical protein ABZ890_12030 [Streptomyces sp. NPDC046984]|uniref:hypothetical protein n=1 Tax=Streptomyces sp. NPDC046984 TaxID=3155138 RepID=UPI0033DD0699
MIRREMFCNGRLIKEIDQINTPGFETGWTDHYVDGSHRWLLDGEEVQQVEAEAFQIAWNAGN